MYSNIVHVLIAFASSSAIAVRVVAWFFSVTKEDFSQPNMNYELL